MSIMIGWTCWLRKRLKGCVELTITNYWGIFCIVIILLMVVGGLSCGALFDKE